MHDVYLYDTYSLGLKESSTSVAVAEDGPTWEPADATQVEGWTPAVHCWNGEVVELKEFMVAMQIWSKKKWWLSGDRNLRDAWICTDVIKNKEIQRVYPDFMFCASSADSMILKPNSKQKKQTHCMRNGF